MNEMFAGGLVGYLCAIGDDAASRMSESAQREWALARASLTRARDDLTDIERQAGVSLSFYDDKDILRGQHQWEVLRVLIWERDGKKCTGCGKAVNDGNWHCHHVKPVTAGGLGNPANLTTLCMECHRLVHRERPTALNSEQALYEKNNTLDKLVSTLDVQPDISIVNLSRVLNKSRTTVYAYMGELEQAGRIHRRNGHGIKVS